MTTNTRSPTSSVSARRDLRLENVAGDVLNNLDLAVILVDSHQRIVYRNALAAAWLPDGADLESTFAEARFLERFDGWAALLSRLLEAEGRYCTEIALPLPRRPAPSILILRCTPFREKDSGRVSGVVMCLEEAAAREPVEARLEVSKRLASLGKLATRVAHELNNPLDGILRYINLAMRAADESPGSKMKSYLAESRTGLMRMVQIIGDLLEFSRATDGEFDQMSINEIVEQAIKSTASAADANGVVVAADFQHPQMPSARGSRLYQVCCNLIQNAIDAMPEGGRLSITTGVVDDRVIIRVADTGTGLPQPVERIFEPFFTTKEPGKGTGLGLAICKDFIEDMKGTITAAQGENGGAVLTVSIPLSSFHRPSRLAARSHG